jgi:Putative transmembrane protein (PGPGW)
MHRLARIGTGYALIAAGTVMIFTPGPGLVTIAGGLAMLSEDVAWAGRAADWLKAKAGRSQKPPEGGDETAGSPPSLAREDD